MIEEPEMTTAALRKPDPLLADPGLLREQGFVAGRWLSARDGASSAVTDPATGAIIADVAALGAGEAETAVDAAHRAFPAWSARLPQDRARILRAWFEEIRA